MEQEAKKYDFIDIFQRLNGALLALTMLSFQTNNRPLFNTALIGFGVTFLLQYVLAKSYRTFCFKASHLWYALLIVFWLLFPLYHIFEGDNALYHHQMEKHLGFLLVGALGLMGGHKWIKLRWCCWAFIVSALLCNCLVLLHCDMQVLLHNTEPLAYWNYVKAEIISQHMKFNMCQNMALLSCYYLYKKGNSGERRASLWLMAVLLPLLLVSSGRIGVATGVLLVLCFALCEMPRRLLRYAVPLGLVVLVGGMAVLYSIDDFRVHYRITPIELKQEPRLMIWSAACDVIARHPLGQGAGAGLEAFHEQAKQNIALHYDNLYNSHPHNLWLYYGVFFGFVGILMISAVFALLPLVVGRGKRRYVVLVMLPFFIEGMFDVFGAAMPVLLFLLPLWVIDNEAV